MVWGQAESSRTAPTKNNSLLTTLSQQREAACGCCPRIVAIGGPVIRSALDRSSAVSGKACALADLLLDTSPYSSGATAVTALAAGLPLLTCPGETFASRLGASLCAATGLEELICPSPKAYQERAIALGHQPAELRRLRRQLLERHGELPLFNTAAWVGQLECLLERVLEGLLEQRRAGPQRRASCSGQP